MRALRYAAVTIHVAALLERFVVGGFSAVTPRGSKDDVRVAVHVNGSVHGKHVASAVYLVSCPVAIRTPIMLYLHVVDVRGISGRQIMA